MTYLGAVWKPAEMFSVLFPYISLSHFAFRLFIQRDSETFSRSSTSEVTSAECAMQPMAKGSQKHKLKCLQSCMARLR